MQLRRLNQLIEGYADLILRTDLVLVECVKTILTHINRFYKITSGALICGCD